MGGKKPVGDHPSRGSYHRRLHTPHLHQQHQHQPGGAACSDGAESSEGGGDVPIYQDFSLFSAFSSSDRFGGILAANDTVPSDLINLPESDFNSKLGGLVETGTEKEREETASPLRATQCCSAALEQNARLEESLRQLQDTVYHMSQAMDRLSYEHTLIVQQLQQQQSFSWQQVMHMQLYGRGDQDQHPHTGGEFEGRHHSGKKAQHQQQPNQPHLKVKGNKAMEFHNGGQQQSWEYVNRQDGKQEECDNKLATTTDEVGEGEALREEIRRLKERLCTVEGRHKTVQGKVSQLDKLYGASSAAWGRRIKALLAVQQDSAACTGITTNSTNGEIKRNDNGTAESDGIANSKISGGKERRRDNGGDHMHSQSITIDDNSVPDTLEDIGKGSGSGLGGHSKELDVSASLATTK